MELVSILISIYNPDLKFLIKQIQSVDEQDYQNLEILIWDDNPLSTIDEEVLKKNILKHPYKYMKCKKNLGYAKAFEKLTFLAEGVYVAYCDQDDIWMSNKVSVLVEAIKKEKAVLVTADRAIIDESDNVIVSSCRKENPSICNTWNTGDHIVPIAIFNTCAIGMNILMRTDIARELLPLPENTAHDKWLTAGASVKGKVVFVEKVLVQYRRHGKNVSGILNGIEEKEDYYNQRVFYSYYLAETFVERFPELDIEDKKLIMNFANARKHKQILKIYEYRKLSPDIAKFEILLCFLPSTIFKYLIKFCKRKKG